MFSFCLPGQFIVLYFCWTTVYIKSHFLLLLKNLCLYVVLLQFCGVFLFSSPIFFSFFLLPFFSFLFYNFNFLNLVYFLYTFLCLPSLLFLFPCSSSLKYIKLLHLPLFSFAYVFFLAFPLNIFVSFVFMALFPIWNL